MQYILYFKRSLILCFFALFIQQTAFAGANLDLLDILKNNGSISEEQYKQLLQTDDATLTDAEEPSYYLDNSRGLEVTSMDGENYINIGAFIGLDAAFYHSEDNQFGDGTEIRHARLSLSGMQNGIWAYDFSLDVSDPAIKVKDAYIENKDSFLWTWRVGQFKQPFSLESLISIKNSLFMERSLMNELTLGRSQGLGLKYQSIDWNMTVGLFGDDYNSDTEDEGDEGWSATTRLVYAPKTAGEHFFHTALAVSKQSTNDENEVRFRTRPESHLTDLKLFDTGKIKDTTLLNRTGLEFAWVKGAWSTQLEWIELSLTREDKDDLVFTGWYSQFSYFITGESRNYRSKSSRFIKIKPLNSEVTAVELALRLSQLNLDDEDIEGGEGRQTTLAINWYYTKNVKLMLNYSRFDYEETADADGDAVGGDHSSFWQARMQMDF